MTFRVFCGARPKGADGRLPLCDGFCGWCRGRYDEARARRSEGQAMRLHNWSSGAYGAVACLRCGTIRTEANASAACDLDHRPVRTGEASAVHDYEAIGARLRQLQTDRVMMALDHPVRCTENTFRRLDPGLVQPKGQETAESSIGDPCSCAEAL